MASLGVTLVRPNHPQWGGCHRLRVSVFPALLPLSSLGFFILGDVCESTPRSGGSQEKGKEASTGPSRIGLMEACCVPLAQGDSESRPLCHFILEMILFFGQREGEGNLNENIQPHAHEISAQNQSSFLIMRAVMSPGSVGSDGLCKYLVCN